MDFNTASPLKRSVSNFLSLQLAERSIFAKIVKYMLHSYCTCEVYASVEERAGFS